MARPPDPHKRAALLAAATRLFSQLGPRRVSVDELARAAGVAKGTVYLYWKGKDALFEAVCASLADDFLRRAKEAVARREAPFEDRLYHLLAAKYETLFELVYRSPHASELIEARNRTAAHVFERADRRYKRMLVALLKTARGGESLALSPGALADLLMSSASARATGTQLAPAAYARRLRALARLTATALAER